MKTSGIRITVGSFERPETFNLFLCECGEWGKWQDERRHRKGSPQCEGSPPVEVVPLFRAEAAEAENERLREALREARSFAVEDEPDACADCGHIEPDHYPDEGGCAHANCNCKEWARP